MPSKEGQRSVVMIDAPAPNQARDRGNPDVPATGRMRSIVAKPWLLWIACLVTVGFAAGVLVGRKNTRTVVVHRYHDRTLPDPTTSPPAAFDWHEPGLPEFPLPPYAEFLRGVVLVIDPGHGGVRAKGGDPNVGPNGVREAEVNLRVSLYLRDFLAAAGAAVHITRTEDVYLHADRSQDLARRVRLANSLTADLFLSIHHNAASNPDANYSLVFYHGTPDDNPASLCAARYLLTGLNDALRLDQYVDSGLRSDTATNPREGYHVLREAHVPAVLVESSFHTNPQEAVRLCDPVYNRREAYGLFLGLARWAQAGLPRIELIRADDSGGSQATRETVIQLWDGLSGRGLAGPARNQIRWDTLRVRLDDKPTAATYDTDRRQVVLPLSLRELAGRELFVDFQNTFGQHVLHPRLFVR